MARLSSEKYLARRAKIITTGMHLFMEKGFNATGIKDITNACGIPKGSFFNYFSSKESFACETVQFGSQYMEKVYEEILNNKEFSPVQRVKNLYRFRANMMIHQFQFKKDCLLNCMSQEMADQSDSIAEAVSEGLNLLFDQIETTLQEAQANNEIHSDRNTHALAMFIENSYRGAMITSKAFRNAETLETFLHFLESDLLK